MRPTRRISRRSFLRTVAGGTAAAGSFVALTGCATLAYTDSDPWDPVGGGRGGRRGPRCSDYDRGRYADPPGRGRSCGGYTDSDTGPNADPPGRGRGGQGGYSDSDSGPNADPPGRGRGGGAQGCTDNDRGPNADPAGRGRSCRGTGYTDRDTGPNADPPGRGRGPR